MSELKTLLGQWICKKDASTHPGLLTDSDIHNIAVAIQEGISETVSADGHREWGKLRDLTRGWLVQQKPGTEPGPLQTHDFERLGSLVVTETPEPTPSHDVSEAPATVPDTENVPPLQVDAKNDAALFFAREHLERCL
ncbi:hypothetical protein JK202_05790 [Gluconobacter sp. Dm-62]|uniref:hypothetical protein n=1 Tax=Gluconobacter sp. Dm-62 TaxID=2799804 RepID=UPI001B8C8468|nr:hypothetical protein [Gluconobacter sp. Dm-62]MBS1102530.1 hypothetical protein [Gluconobacter sp. Dm-62]